MENIYKIRIRSNQDPRDQYPSERRYSSSIVLGFSVMFLVLAMTSSLMGTLVVRKINITTTNRSIPVDNEGVSVAETAAIPSTNITNETESQSDELVENTTTTTTDLRFLQKVERDLIDQKPPPEQSNYKNNINIAAIVTAGAFIMAFGCLLAAATGLLAWKHWYIDQNITWFCLSASFSTITASISLLLILVTLMDMDYYRDPYPDFDPDCTRISFGLSANILITSLVGVIWSALATKISFHGVKNSYPDDMVIARSGGRVEVCTVRKGNRLGRVIPPDILNHFPTTGKLAKYFPGRKQDDGLPKAESNREYEERVKQFLAGQPENNNE